MIKQFSLILVLICSVCLDVIGLEGRVPFRLENQIGVPINRLFISISDSNYWSGDILSNNEKILDKSERFFNLELAKGCNEIDILVTDIDGSLYLFDRKKICSSIVEQLILDIKESKSITGLNFLELIFRNEVEYSLRGLYMKPFDSIYWVRNYLQVDRFIESQTGFGVLLPISNQDMIYDIKAIDIRDNSYTFSVDLYGGAGDIITIPIESNDIDN